MRPEMNMLPKKHSFGFRIYYRVTYSKGERMFFVFFGFSNRIQIGSYYHPRKIRKCNQNRTFSVQLRIDEVALKK